MLTLFACPKSFSNPHIATIQRNAIISWTLLRPKLEITLLGNEEGTPEICRELGLCHIPNIAHNKFGTPLLSDIFQKTQDEGICSAMCYVNADLILTSSFSEATEQAKRLGKPFLLSGGQWNAEVRQQLDFSDPGWENLLMRIARSEGNFNFWGNDYFVFTRGLYREMPPFAIGRGWFDGWLFWRALSLRAAVIDASSVVFAVHQNHDYAHANVTGYVSLFNTEEAKCNFKLAGMGRHWALLDRATHVSTPRGIKRICAWRRRLRFLFRVALLKTKLYRLVVYQLGSLRHSTGLHRAHHRKR